MNSSYPLKIAQNMKIDFWLKHCILAGEILLLSSSSWVVQKLNINKPPDNFQNSILKLQSFLLTAELDQDSFKDNPE